MSGKGVSLDAGRRKRKAAKAATPRSMSQSERAADATLTTQVVLPVAAVALRLLAAADARGVIYIAADERAAEDVGRVLARLAPPLDVLVFPPWDCLPLDRASPSRASMGRRVSVLQRLLERADKPFVLITSVEAAVQRTPPLHRLADLKFEIKPGDDLDVAGLAAFAHRYGYVVEERVGEPGDIAFHGHVIEVFPADAHLPFRIELSDGRVAAIHAVDGGSGRSAAALQSLVLRPASEIVPDRGDGEAPLRTAGLEHRLAEFYRQSLPSIFDARPDAHLFLAPDMEGRQSAIFEELGEAGQAFGSRSSAAGDGMRDDVRRMFLDEESWKELLSRSRSLQVQSPNLVAVPRFADRPKPIQAFDCFLEDALGRGMRVVLAGVARDLTAFAKHLTQHGGRAPHPASDWQTVLDGEPGSFFSIDVDLDEGIEDRTRDIALVTAADVLGTRAHHGIEARSTATALLTQPAMRIGDTVIHEDHGLGILRGLDTVEVGGGRRDAVRIDYRDGASLLVPIEDLDRVWRYGADEDAVSLDRLHTDAWAKRRISIEQAVIKTACGLVAMAEAQRSRPVPKLVAPEKLFARLAARFRYPLTGDQSRAIGAIVEDLASGRPMDRLVCGDVGFGKTEVAVRAAAIALLAGKQVALVAPTTVLARQHLDTFGKRLGDMGFTIAGLSRLETGAEARRVKAGLADGTIHMVIGTQALAASSVAFRDLGLLIIDEEQKFGAKLKSGLREMASDGHVLTLTATPIPRTLQLALVGVQTVSVIATPPVRRRPVRTFVAPFDAAAMRVALMREHARGGQSFAIVPRIADIAPLKARLAEIVPELHVLVAHGELAPEDADQAMVDFAQGRGDVLLATNIVESGLDVPRANTMMVWDAGQFGLAQLHQIRGRVGRGRLQGVVYLLTDHQHQVGESTRARLTALQGYDQLGAGFAISARDLDLRGSGDLIGDEQAGHLRLIGLELYQSILARAVRKAKGEADDDRPPPDLHVACTGHIPEDYLAEADLRIEVYSRLSRLGSGKAIRAFRAEVEDRFGALPPEAEALFALARLRAACRRLDVAALSVGPRGVALTSHPEGLERCGALASTRPDVERHGARLVWTEPAMNADPLRRADALLDMLEAATPEPA